jgi:molybdate transport system substrate-binding protein
MIRTLVTVASLVLTVAAVETAEVKVISANGMREVIAETKARFEKTSGHHAERVVKGEADLAVQAEHEIRCVPGAAFLGYPTDLRRSIVFIGAVGASTTDAAAAKSYLTFVTGPDVAPVIKAKCLSPG